MDEAHARSQPSRPYRHRSVGPGVRASPARRRLRGRWLRRRSRQKCQARGAWRPACFVCRRSRAALRSHRAGGVQHGSGRSGHPKRIVARGRRRLRQNRAVRKHLRPRPHRRTRQTRCGARAAPAGNPGLRRERAGQPRRGRRADRRRSAGCVRGRTGVARAV